jgi:hypothetical protein
MATPQDIQNQQSLNNELTETTQLANELINSYRTLTQESSELFISETDRFKLKRKEKELAKDISKDIQKSLRGQKIDSQNILDLEKKRLNGTLRIKDVNYLIEKSKSKQEAIIDRINEAIAEGFIDEQKAANLQSKITAEYEKQKTILKKLASESEQIEKKLGITYKIFDGIAKIPILNSLIKIEKVKEAMEESADKTSSSFKVFRTGISATFNQMGKSLKDPLILLGAQIALLKKFYDLYGAVNQRITDQGKQLNINKEQSQALYESAFKYASEQRNVFVTEARILEGRHKLNEALGTSIIFTNKEAITAEKLSHYYGISEEQNAHLAVLAREIGQTNDDILNTVIKTAVNQKAQFGGTLSNQKILQKVSSVSGDILTKFKGNVDELTKAVMQADRLGLNLDQVNKISESLLNFEQSIESELKAELLTGKAINLEKARAAALSGDTVKLTNEIATQVGNIHKFEKMNVIQRQAYAEAFGMSAGEMGDMLRKREFEAKLGADISKSATEQLKLAKERGITIEESVKKDLEAKSLAELQKYTFEKIQSLLARIASGPMATIYKYIEKGLKGVEGILGAFNKMTGGGLGNALGAAILGAPLLLVGIRLIAGGLRGLISAPGSRVNPGFQYVLNAMGGMMGGGAGNMGGAVAGKFYKGGQFLPGGGRAPAGGIMIPPPGAGAGAGAGAGGGLRGFMGGGMGLGLAAMGVGMLTSAATSDMEAGNTRTSINTVGGAASGALTGAMIGSIIPGLGTAAGAIIGGLVGGMSSLTSEMKATRAKEEGEKASRADTEKRTQALLEQMSIRPISLNVSNETIGKWNTYSSQNGANTSLA